MLLMRLPDFISIFLQIHQLLELCVELLRVITPFGHLADIKEQSRHQSSHGSCLEASDQLKYSHTSLDGS